jgi:ABC-2 type transport system permease protein
MQAVALARTPAPPAQVRERAAEWRRGYWTMTLWQLAGLRLWLAALAALQVLVGGGSILAVALFFRRIPASAELFVSTGVPVINLIMVGILLGPQLVAGQKVQGGYDFLRTLPVPQTATAAGWYTVCLIASLPGAAFSLVVAEARYGIPLSISAAIVPAALLTVFTGTMLGYALGHVPTPAVTQLVTQLLFFAVFGFTPIAFPARQLPGWLADLNWWLPFGHMAVIVRAGLTTGVVTGVASSYLIVAVWGVAGALSAAWVLGRRG